MHAHDPSAAGPSWRYAASTDRCEGRHESRLRCGARRRRNATVLCMMLLGPEVTQFARADDYGNSRGGDDYSYSYSHSHSYSYSDMDNVAANESETNSSSIHWAAGALTTEAPTLAPSIAPTYGPSPFLSDTDADTSYSGSGPSNAPSGEPTTSRPSELPTAPSPREVPSYGEPNRTAHMPLFTFESARCARLRHCPPSLTSTSYRADRRSQRRADARNILGADNSVSHRCTDIGAER